MKKMRKLAALLTALCVAFPTALTAAAENTVDVTSLYKSKDTETSWKEEEAQKIDVSSLNGAAYEITSEGTYMLSGKGTGQIVVNVSEKEDVRLILNGVELTSNEGPAIYEKQADKLIVTLTEGSENVLKDGAAVTDEDDTIGAALYAEDDLSINGQGSLTVNGTAKHGIQSKADLIIAGGTITVNALNDGIRGRNSVLVLDGTLTVNCGGDGIVSTREDKEGKGWVLIAGGEISLTTGTGAGTKTVSKSGRGGGRGQGFMTENASSSDSGTSSKGIKAATDLTVVDGTISLNTEDDGLHAVNVSIYGGTISISSGDDGIHADTDAVIWNGTIAIAQCYEGLEGTNVTIHGGTVTIVSSDDGINASGGKDSSEFGGRGNDRFSGSGNSGMLQINGGQVEVTASGDGLDSNGSISITGGVTGVWAASSMGEGAIDFNGSGTITGGLLIITSVNGVMQDTAMLTGAPLISVPVNGNGKAGETLTVTADGNTGSYTPAQAYDTLLIAGAGLQEGTALTVSSGKETLFSGTVSSDMIGTGSSAVNGFNRGMGSGFDRGFGRGMNGDPNSGMERGFGGKRGGQR